MKYIRLKTDHYYLVNSLSLLHLDLARSRVDTLGYFRLDGNQYLSSKYFFFVSGVLNYCSSLLGEAGVEAWIYFLILFHYIQLERMLNIKKVSSTLLTKQNC